MKNRTLLAAGVAATAALLLSSASLRASVLNSPHDFSAESWNVSPSDPNSVCGPCHQPHHADSTVIPLWGHQTSTGPWIMYNTNTVPVSQMKAVPSPTPTGPSLACLSCHDGTVAVNSYAGAIQGGTATYITNSARIGQDLTHTHPISFTYDATLVGTGPNQDQWLYNPDTTQVLQPNAGQPFVPGNNMTISGFLLTANHRVECSSCHDVHNQEGTPYNIVSNPKLVKILGTAGGKGSLLCRSCHNK
jgi:hypothetical protein